jgi:hypothetical protein
LPQLSYVHTYFFGLLELDAEVTEESAMDSACSVPIADSCEEGVLSAVNVVVFLPGDLLSHNPSAAGSLAWSAIVVCQWRKLTILKALLLG